MSRLPSIASFLAILASAIPTRGQSLAGISSTSPISISVEGAPIVAGSGLGWVLDSATGEVRHVMGLLESARMRDAFPGWRFSLAAVSGRRNYLLGVREDTGTLGVATVFAGQPHWRPIDTGDCEPSHLVLGSLGSAALIICRTANRLSVVSGLPNAPTIVRTFDLSPWPLPAVAAAITDDARLALAALASGGTTRLIVLPHSGQPRIAGEFAPISSIRFRPGRSDALFTTPTDGNVHEIRNLLTSLEIRTVVGKESGLLSPMDLAFTADGTSAVIADPVARLLFILNLHGGPSLVMPCSCAPHRLEQLDGGSLFSVHGESPGSILLLDASHESPRLVTPGGGLP